MLIDIDALMPGDLLLIKYNDTYWHTMMVVNRGYLAHAPGAGKPCVVERIADFAEEAVASRDDWTAATLKNNLFAYRYNGSAMPYPSWVSFAEQWCDGVTHYAYQPTVEQTQKPEWKNYPRYRGVLKGDDDGHNAASLPFGPDALFRAVKWVQRYHMRQAFSQNRGTTCCAFVMACVQAAFFNAGLYSDHKSRLKELSRVIGEGGKFTIVNTEGSKEVELPGLRAERNHEKGQPNAGGALRENSNRGLGKEMTAKLEQKRLRDKRDNAYTEAELAEIIWGTFRQLGLVDVSWKELRLPAALRHDAKYMYSRTFNSVLKGDGEWTAL